MSGIVGCFHRNGQPADSTVINHMTGTLTRRGPDGGAALCAGPIGMGHRMLRTTPESAYEVLPFADAERNLMITADARLDNREDLLRALGLPSKAEVSLPDSQVILASYGKWGTGCAERLLGDFAFAIWDGGNQQLFCARDHVGVKSFCYHLSDRAFYFASEIKALLVVDEIPRRIDQVRVADFLMSVCSNQEYTFFERISRLPPGHWMLIGRDATQLNRYWSPDPSKDLHHGSDAEYAEAFLEVFSEAVRCRLRSHSPVSAMLSGGLDSSSIVCMARRRLNGSKCVPLVTHSVLFEEGSACDESPFIRAVLNGGGCEPHFTLFEQRDNRPVSSLRSILAYVDEPLFAPNSGQSMRLLEAIRRDGGRVVLDGHGGDETVSYGSSYLKELARAHRWTELTSALRIVHRATGKPLLPLLKDYAAFGFDPLISQSRWLRSGRRLWRAARSRILRRTRQERPSVQGRDLIARALAERMGSDARYNEWRRNARLFRSERDDHWRTLTDPAQSLALEALSAMASAVSLELRFPFWDRRVVEFCLALPPTQKLGGGWGRMILRRAMEGVLPSEVQWRRDKTDFMPNVLEGLRRNEASEIARIAQNAELVGEFVDVERLRFLLSRIEGGRATPREFFSLSTVAALYYWLESGRGARADNRS